MKVAVVGCGYWGKNLVRNFYELGALGLICESCPEHQELARTLAPGVRVVSDFEEVLSSDVSAVVLATPAATHFELGLRVLRAKKDLFVEKPLALTRDHGERLLREQGDRIIMVGHILEYHPACVKLVELVRAGELGDLCYLYSNRLSLGKVRREENILWSFAPHDIALMNRIVGSLPKTVSAFGGAYIQEKNADVTITNLTYSGRVRGHIHVSWLHPFKEQRLVVIGTEKMASFDGVSGSLTVYDQRVEWRRGEPVPIKGDGRRIPVPQDEPLRLECSAFISALESRCSPISDGESGLEVLAVLEAAQASLASSSGVVLVEDVPRRVPGGIA